MTDISIITPSFNSSKYIVQAYKSILAQADLDFSWEWIVVDDASTDNTADILKSISDHDKRVLLICNSMNLGAARSRNIGILNANGHYIAFLDSDDIWSPYKLSLQLRSMQVHSIDFSFTGYRFLSSDGESTGRTVDISHKNLIFNFHDFLSKRATFCFSSVVLRRSFLADTLMPDIRTGQDYALWLSLFVNGGNALLIPYPLTFYRIGHASLSRNKFRKACRHWRTLQDFGNLGLFRTLFYFCLYAFRAVFKSK